MRSTRRRTGQQAADCYLADRVNSHTTRTAADAVLGILNCLDDTSAVLRLLRDGVDATQLLRQHVADRGVGPNGEWIGFAAAREHWLGSPAGTLSS